MNDLERVEQLVKELIVMIEDRNKERDRFKAALEFYADPRNYAERRLDDGRLARKALLGLPA